MHRSKILKTFLAGALMLLGMAAGAASNIIIAAAGRESESPYDPHEIAKLPRYCPYTQSYRQEVLGGNNPAEIARFDRLFGPSLNSGVTMFSAMHHYCNGLFKTNQALLFRQRPEWRRFLLGSAVEEFDYVIARAPDTFVLLPEILTRKGENLVKMGRATLAAATLHRAIELKRDYWPPYATLSDLYLQSGDTAKAREVLEKGLASAPAEKALTRRLRELSSVKRKAEP